MKKTLNIPNYAQLVDLISNIEEILTAPPQTKVTVWERNFDGEGQTTTAGALRHALETSTYDQNFVGWLFVFPGDEPGPKGDYQGWFAGSTFLVRFSNDPTRPI